MHQSKCARKHTHPLELQGRLTTPAKIKGRGHTHPPEISGRLQAPPTICTKPQTICDFGAGQRCAASLVSSGPDVSPPNAGNPGECAQGDTRGKSMTAVMVIMIMLAVLKHIKPTNRFNGRSCAWLGDTLCPGSSRTLVHRGRTNLYECKKAPLRHRTKRAGHEFELQTTP